MGVKYVCRRFTTAPGRFVSIFSRQSGFVVWRKIKLFKRVHKQKRKKEEEEKKNRITATTIVKVGVKNRIAKRNKANKKVIFQVNNWLSKVYKIALHISLLWTVPYSAIRYYQTTSFIISLQCCFSLCWIRIISQLSSSLWEKRRKKETKNPFISSSQFN